MLREAKELLKATDEIMDLCKSQMIDEDMLLDMSGDEFEIYKKMHALMEQSKALVLEQARLMDDMDAKLDKLIMLFETQKIN